MKSVQVRQTNGRARSRAGRRYVFVSLAEDSPKRAAHKEFLRQKQARGIAQARERGVHMGRPRAVLPENFGELVRQWEARELPLEALLAQCGVSRTTFYKYMAQYRNYLALYQQSEPETINKA